MSLSKEDIFSNNDLQHTEIHIPEWGHYKIRELSGVERDDIEADLAEISKMAEDNNDQPLDEINKKIRKTKGKMIVMCLLDEDGTQVFSSSDISKLEKVSAKIIDRLWNTCRDYSGIGATGESYIEKNLESSHSEEQ